MSSAQFSQDILPRFGKEDILRARECYQPYMPEYLALRWLEGETYAAERNGVLFDSMRPYYTSFKCDEERDAFEAGFCHWKREHEEATDYE